jgi:hypothetical protein
MKVEARAKTNNTPRRWITRERPKIDRVACPWLICRFIDPEAEFIFVPPTEVIEKAKELDAIPYDVHGVQQAVRSGSTPKCEPRLRSPTAVLGSTVTRIQAAQSLLLEAFLPKLTFVY